MSRARILADYVSSGDELAVTTATADAALPKAGGAMTGAITTNSTFDGIDIATRDAILTSTTTTANAALPKAGGAMTGAITTNSTFDGVDIAVRDALHAPKASPTFTGTVAIPNVANLETAVVANTAKVTNYNQTLADINALDITELGTVTSGVLEDAVTYRNINQDLASTDSPTFNNLGVSQVNGNTHYRSNFIDVFPKYGGAGVAYSANSVWYNIGSIQGRYQSSKGHLESLMLAPPSGFTEAFYLTVIGGTGSGSGSGYFKLTDSTGNYDGISSTFYADGYYAYAAHFSKTMLIGTFNGVTLRSKIGAGGGSGATVIMWMRNTGSGGYAGMSRVILEQRIYLA